MAKVNDRKIYPNVDIPSLLDFLLGTKEANGKTRSFPLQSVIQLINGVNGTNNVQLKFSDGTDPDIDYFTEGSFFTDNNNTAVGSFSKLIFNKETVFPIDISQVFTRIGELQNIVLRLENPEDPNNFFNFKVVSFEDHTEYFVFGIETYNNLYLGELKNEQIYSLYFTVSSDLPEDFSRVVYFNSADPTTATIFDLNNPPVTNDNSLKANDVNLYVANDATTWVYKTSTAAYETKVITGSSSNFCLSGTAIDAGGSKTAAIERSGTVGGAQGTAPNHFVTKVQIDLKEDKANKATDFSTVNDILFPTVKASKTYTDNVGSNKLDKNNAVTANPQAYIKKADGGQDMLDYVSSTIINDSGVVGGSVADALNTLNTTLGINSTAIAYVESNGNNTTAQIGNSRKAFSTIDAALDALPSTGGLIKIGVGTFLSPTLAKIKDNTKFFGSGKPYPNMTISYTDQNTKPVITSPTKLVGGTILNGVFIITGKNNIEIHDLGIDVGKEWIDANGGTPVNGLWHGANLISNSVDNNLVPPSKGIVVENIASLNYSATAATHAVVLENITDAKIDKVSTYYGIHGMVIKGRGINLSNVIAYGHSANGVIIKANNYAYSSDINVSDVYISSIGNLDGGGFRLVSESGGILQRVNVNNLHVENTTFGVLDDAGVDGLNMSNVTVKNIQQGGIYISEYSKKVNLNNISIDGTGAGYNGIQLVSLDLNSDKALSNCNIKNSAVNGLYAYAVGGIIKLNNVYVEGDIRIDGGATSNVRGFNVSATGSFSGSLFFDNSSVSNDYISSINNNGTVNKSTARIDNLGYIDTPGGITSKSIRVGTSTAEKVGIAAQFHRAGSNFNYIQFTNGLTGEAVSDGLLIGVTDDAKAYFYNNENTEMSFATNGVIRQTISPSGVLKIIDLAGTGIRTVVADASGNLSATDVSPTSGTYTPTLTGTANISNLSFINSNYTRIGNVVTVFVSVSVTQTLGAGTLTSFNISLPINRALSTPVNFGSGVFFNSVTSIVSTFLQSQSTSTVGCVFFPASVTAGTVNLTFQYDVTQ